MSLFGGTSRVLAVLTALSASAYADNWARVDHNGNVTEVIVADQATVSGRHDGPWHAIPATAGIGYHFDGKTFAAQKQPVVPAGSARPGPARTVAYSYLCESASCKAVATKQISDVTGVEAALKKQGFATRFIICGAGSCVMAFDASETKDPKPVVESFVDTPSTMSATGQAPSIEVPAPTLR